MNLEQFIASEFNTETIDRRIWAEEKIISQTKKKIQELESIRMEQNEKPWYEWEGVSFSASFRDTQLLEFGSELLPTFEDFVVAIIKEKDNDFHYSEYKDFYIVSPNEEEYKVPNLKELPFVKEYFERKELQKNLSLTTFNTMLTVLQSTIQSMENKIKETDKYTEKYIQTLQEEKEKKEKQLEILQQKRKDESDSKVVNRIQEINTLLHRIDEKLKQFNYLK